MNLQEIMIMAKDREVIEGTFAGEVFYLGMVNGTLRHLEKNFLPPIDSFFAGASFKVLDKAEVTLKLLSADYKTI